MPDEPQQLLLPLAAADSEIHQQDAPAPLRRERLGPTTISYHAAQSILTAPSGFIGAFDYTLNPYSGCAFACSYCYAAFFVRDRGQQDSWGQWVRVKENALDLLRRKRKKPLVGKTIYMSSVTDPYQPIERELGLTRALLEELASHHQVRLVVQTRSPLVTRDIDVLQCLSAVRVNMTITTDDEAVRKVFEPSCASIGHRLAAITEVRAAGLPTAITMTPLLPVSDPVAFAERLRATGVERFVVQPFHVSSGQFVAGTREAALALCAERGWDAAAYQQTVALLRERLPDLQEGKRGFAPI